MTPEERQMLRELMEWKRQKEVQQLSFPLDDASKNLLNTFSKTGTSASTTQTLNLTGNAQNISVPAQPTAFLTGVIDGQQVSIPYYS